MVFCTVCWQNFFNILEGADFMVRTSLDALPDVLSPREVASALGVGYAKALHLVKYGKIIHIRAGNHYLITKQKFLEWLHADKTKVIDTDK
jgi:excisionase family DNA binding protein